MKVRVFEKGTSSQAPLSIELLTKVEGIQLAQGIQIELSMKQLVVLLRSRTHRTD